jgi:hypothetical protein
VPRELTCPICGKPAGRLPENRAFPFCGPRCRLLDLGKWLSEDYRVPGASVGAVDGAGEEAPPRRAEEEGDR